MKFWNSWRQPPVAGRLCFVHRGKASVLSRFLASSRQFCMWRRSLPCCHPSPDSTSVEMQARSEYPPPSRSLLPHLLLGDAQCREKKKKGKKERKWQMDTAHLKRVSAGFIIADHRAAWCRRVRGCLARVTSKCLSHQYASSHEEDASFMISVEHKWALWRVETEEGKNKNSCLLQSPHSVTLWFNNDGNYRLQVRPQLNDLGVNIKKELAFMRFLTLKASRAWRRYRRLRVPRTRCQVHCNGPDPELVKTFTKYGEKKS